MKRLKKLISKVKKPEDEKNLDIFKNVHERIKDGSLDQNFIDRAHDRFPFERCFKYNEKSALLHAVELENFNISELLLKNGVHFCPKEDKTKILNNISKGRKTVLFNLIQNNLCELEKLSQHIAILVESTKVKCNQTEISLEKCTSLIIEAFKNLQFSRLIDPILQLVSTGKDLQINFDFESDSIECLDPLSSNNVLGNFLPQFKVINLGANSLLSEKTDKKLKVYGVLAHELCHYAMYLVYKNDCNPYKMHEDHKFDKICEDTKNILEDISKRDGGNMLEEINIFHLVFEKLKDGKYANYAIVLHHAELIVRIPHSRAFCGKNNSKFENVEKTFPGLLTFYEKTTLIDVKEKTFLRTLASINKMFDVSSEIDDEYFTLDVKKLNFALEDKKVIEIYSNCPKLTMKALYKMHQNNGIFMTLSNFNNKALKKILMKNLENFNNFPEKKISLYIRCHQIGVKDTATFQTDFLKFDWLSIILVKEMTPDHGNEGIYLKHTTDDLTKDSIKDLSVLTVDFQGHKMRVKEFYSGKFDKISLEEFYEPLIKLDKDTNIDVEAFLLQTSVLPEPETTENVEKFELKNISEAAKSNLVLFFKKNEILKTAELKSLCYILKKEFPKFWIIYIDYNELSENHRQNFESSSSLQSFVTEKLKVFKAYEKSIFNELFESKKIIFVLENFDNSSTKFVKNFLKQLIASKNKIWISMTSESSFQWLDKKSFKSFKLKKLTNEESWDELLRLKSMQEEIFDYVNKLGRIDCDNSNLFLQYVFRLKCLPQDSGFQVFEKITSYEIECALENEEPKPKLNQAKEALHVLAIQILFKVEIFSNGQKHLVENISKALKNCKFMKNEIEFIHNTFTTYFVAESIYENVFYVLFEEIKVAKKPNEDFVRIFILCLQDSKKMRLVRAFLNDALTLLEPKFELIKNFQGKLEPLETAELSSNVFQNMANEGCLNMIRLTSRMFVNVEIYQFWLRKAKNENSVLMVAAQYQRKEFMEKLIEDAKIIFKEKTAQLITHQNNKGSNIFHFAVQNEDLEVLEFLLKETKILTSEKALCYLLNKRNKEDQKFYFYSLSNKNLNIFNLLEEVKKYLLEKKLKKKPSSIPKPDKDKSTTFLHMLIVDKNLEDMRKVCEALEKNNFLIEKDLVTLMFAVAQNENFGTLTCVWDCVNKKFFADDEGKKKLLLQFENPDLETFFHFACKNKSKQQFESFCELYESVLGPEETLKLIEKETKFKENALTYTLLTRSTNIETISALWKYIQKLSKNKDLPAKILLKDNFKDKNIFNGPISNIISTLYIFMKFIIELFDEAKTNSGTKDDFARTVLEQTNQYLLRAADYCKCEEFENFFSACDGILEDTLSLFFKKLLTESKNKDNSGILQISLDNRELGIFKFLVQTAKKYLSPVEFETILTAKNDFQISICSKTLVMERLKQTEVLNILKKNTSPVFYKKKIVHNQR